MPTPWPQPWPLNMRSAPEPAGAAKQETAQTGALGAARAAAVPARSREMTARVSRRRVIWSSARRGHASPAPRAGSDSHYFAAGRSVPGRLDRGGLGEPCGVLALVIGAILAGLDRLPPGAVVPVPVDRL